MQLTVYADATQPFHITLGKVGIRELAQLLILGLLLLL